MKKILTVSIAAYNIADTLREVVEPFLLEDVIDRVEVLIVDDGSKDDTAKIAAEFVEKYPNTFRLISKENGGWGSTINTGMRAATGKYFKQLDGDDYFSYENLSDFLDYLGTCDSDIVHSPFVTYTDRNGAILNVLNDFSWKDYACFPKRRTLYLSECPGVRPEMHNFAIKVDLIQKSDIFITEHCFYTDVELSLKAFNISNTISFYDRPIYYYRLAFSGQSMGLEGVRKHYRDNQRMLMGMLKYYDEEVSEPWAKDMVKSRLIAACDLMYRMYFALECTKKQKNELIEFDSFLCAHYTDLYCGVWTKAIALLRKTHFIGYKWVSRKLMSKDRRYKRNFFEGE